MDTARSHTSYGQVPPSPRLAGILVARRARLQSEIAQALRSVPGSPYAAQSDDVLERWAGAGIEATVTALTSGTAAPLEDHARQVARQRRELGFQLHHVVQGIVLDRDTTLLTVLRASHDSGEAIEWTEAINTCGRLILACFSQTFAEEARESEGHISVLHERQRLARELHDSVTQSIYGVTLYAEVAARHLAAGQAEKAVESLGCVRETAMDVLREMRLLLFELTPPNLRQNGLAHVLAERLAAVEGRTGIKTQLRVLGVDRLPSETEVGLLGIAREALHNAWNHAHPTSVTMTLERKGSTVSLEVRDDGIGFDLGEPSSKEGLGLGTMHARAAELGGQLTIETRASLGTVVHVEIPVELGTPPSRSPEALPSPAAAPLGTASAEARHSPPTEDGGP